MLGLGVLLERYSDEIINAITDPYSGIQVQCKFPPSMAEVKDLCEYEAARVERRKQFAIAIVRQERLRRTDLTNLFLAADHPRYAEMVAKSQKSDADVREFRFGHAWNDKSRPGIWIVRNWLGHDAR